MISANSQSSKALISNYFNPGRLGNDPPLSRGQPIILLPYVSYSLSLNSDDFKGD